MQFSYDLRIEIKTDHHTDSFVASQICYKSYSGSKVNIKAEILEKGRGHYFKNAYFWGKHI